MNTLATKVAITLMVIAVVLGVGGFVLYQNAQSIAKNSAKSLCTNLSLFKIDQSRGASYATDTLISGYESDLNQLGYTCDDNGKLKKVNLIKVTNEMHPSTTAATCEAPGALVLPEVENTRWEQKVEDEWTSVDESVDPGTYDVRLLPDDGYKLSSPVRSTLVVEEQLSDCEEPEEVNPLHQCRTSGLNGGPTFLALDPGKYGQYNYGAPFTETTVEGARQVIYEQAMCDPVWMVQKYREYVDYKLSSDQAHAKVVELINQAKAGDHEQWDSMVGQIMNQFDNSKHEFTWLGAGEYHSLGVVTNTTDGIPRIVDLIVYDTGTAILRSHVTYADGTTAVLDLRTECNLQLRTPTSKKVVGPGEAPRMAEIPRDREGGPVKEKPKPDEPKGFVPPKESTPPTTAPPKETTPPTQPPTTPPTAPPTTPPTTAPPTTPPSKKPKSSNPDDYKHKPDKPKATEEPVQAKPDPVVTKQPGGGGVVDTPTKAPGSESGVTAPGADPAPTKTHEPPPPAPGANDPAPNESSCVPAPGKSEC